jgi:dihydroorotate dehydrogenase (fumarate)
MTDLTTTYLGLKLKHPLVASSSPLTKTVDGARRLEDAGVSAIVMHSLFEEQITHESLELDHYLHRGTESFSEALDFFPDLGSYNLGPDRYLDLIRHIKAVAGVPVIGSLNGVSTGGWVRYARMIEQAGADALELNIYYLPTDADLTSAELERAHVDLVKAVRAEVTIPLAVKLGPFYTALPNLASLLVGVGADGLVLFNRFFQPDIDLAALAVVPDVALSDAEDMRLPLRWIAILSARLGCDFALTSGVTSAEGVIKAVMSGANVAMTTSEILRNGLGRPREILADMQAWMDANDYASVQQMHKSMNQHAVAEPAAFERANYMKALKSFDHAVP